jgi:hypothetical protein
MRYRKNFFSGDKEWLVLTYIYGKENAMEGRNIRSKKLSSSAQALQYAKSQSDYPHVEVIDPISGDAVWSGGSGVVFNPRKRLPTAAQRTAWMREYSDLTGDPQPKPHDYWDTATYLFLTGKTPEEAAKKFNARQNPRRRKNPSSRWTDLMVKRREELTTTYRRWIRDLKKAGAPEALLPPMRSPAIGQAAQRGAQMLASSKYMEEDARELLSSTPNKIAHQVLQTGSGGIFGKFTGKYPEIFIEQGKQTEKEIVESRKFIARVDADAAKMLSKAKKEADKVDTKREDAKIKRLEAQAKALREEVDDDVPADVLADMAQDLDSQEYDYVAGEEEEEEYSPPETRSHDRTAAYHDRMGKYRDHESSTRRTDIRPPAEALSKARADILLYALEDGTTQVWTKGSITVTLEPSVHLASYTIAHRYANKWRGINPSGGVREDAKKRRLKTAVYLLSEGKKTPKQIEAPVVRIKKGEKDKVRKIHALPDMDNYALKGDRSNPRRPRRRRNTPWSEHSESPYYKVLLQQGMRYSHSTPVTHPSGKVQHHTHRLANTDFYISYYQSPLSGKWVWEGSKSGSGRMHRGFGASELATYAKKAVKRHAKRVKNPSRRSPLKFSFQWSKEGGTVRFRSGKVGKVGRIEVSVRPKNSFHAYLYDHAPDSWVSMEDYIGVSRSGGAGSVPYATKVKVYKAAQAALEKEAVKRHAKRVKNPSKARGSLWP